MGKFRRKKSNYAIAVAVVALFAIDGFAQLRRTSPELIDQKTLRAHIKFLSDDLLEGRGTGARGGVIAAKYLAAQLEALGLEGAAPGGSFFQQVSLVGVKADPNTKLVVSSRNDKETFKFA